MSNYNMENITFRASNIAPGYNEVMYWIDTTESQLGKAIKVYNHDTSKWELIMAESQPADPTIKTDIAALKADVAPIKADMPVVKTDITTLKTEVSTLKTRCGTIESAATALAARVAALESAA